MSQRTPGPWWTGECEADQGEYIYDGCIYSAPSPEDVQNANAARGTEHEFDPGPYQVAKCDSLTDAEFIVRACNSHDELLALLEGIADYVEDAGGQIVIAKGSAVHQAIAAAIRKARGEG